MRTFATLRQMTKNGSDAKCQKLEVTFRFNHGSHVTMGKRPDSTATLKRANPSSSIRNEAHIHHDGRGRKTESPYMDLYGRVLYELDTDVLDFVISAYGPPPPPAVRWFSLLEDPISAQSIQSATCSQRGSGCRSGEIDGVQHSLSR
ncbi:Hypothetical predicted protein [Pelobates cultripes]|uniref:Uncharacterized protein n=1 Tax=Pelobates cultripes TaxID=61616 RepID=A0AAD1T3V8_PELCU|nr:Hypothetical predicted protein [Pelobates cultripes]